MFVKENILLTLDYELFFGLKSGSIEKSLLEPLDLFLSVVNNIKPSQVIIFVDTFFLFRLRTEKKEQTDKDYKKIKIQLINLYKLGYKIELHTHSHWIDAIYEEKNSEWIFPSMKKYKLQDIELYKDDSWNYSLEKWMNVCVNELKIIFNEIDEFYEPEYFRAGGWTLEPFDRLFPILKAINIKYDSSIAHDFIFKSEAHDIDFRGVPKLAQWSFSSNIRKDKGKVFIELPITSSIMWKMVFRFFTFYYNITSKNNYPKDVFGDGQSIIAHSENIWKKLLKKQVYMLNFENLDHRMMKKIIIKYQKNKIFNKDDKIVFIAHPKGFSKYYLEELRMFLEDLT